MEAQQVSFEDEENEVEIEEVTLLEVKPHGRLLLLDKRRLLVNPGDMSIAVCWSPTSLLEISDPKDGRFFNLRVTHPQTDQHIRARWE